MINGHGCTRDIRKVRPLIDEMTSRLPLHERDLSAYGGQRKTILVASVPTFIVHGLVELTECHHYALDPGVM